MLRRLTILLILLLVAAAAVPAAPKDRKGKKADAGGEKAGQAAKEDEGPLSSKTFSGLKLRPIGPALMSGRISDFAVHPETRSVYYVATASGGLWKTTNSGTTWDPIFDDKGSYSIGCVTLDPNRPLTVWVGTGENNSQRSVAYGDGVYKSTDGGVTFENVGLKESEHIGKILVDPRDSNVVYVAAQGPLWSAGGDRGLYKTKDGGKTWDKVLEISENTGVSDIVMDPRDPDVIYAAAYQRRRHVWTLINGGPESTIHKTTDAGASWHKIDKGLPEVDLGRIGLAISPVNPDVVYAIVEAEPGEGGFYRSTDAGGNWKKQSDYVSGSPQYYQEIVPHPQDVDTVYSLDTWLMVTQDGGKNFSRVPNLSRHVDDHALWIDPDDPRYMLVGSDGGIYESFDAGALWQYKANLSITQFYKVTPDNAKPFYNVYGGTQDNFTLGGPSRTKDQNGITNRDWFVTLGGDGFEPQIDPEDPNIVYSQSQYGGLARFDKKSGEAIDIQPQVGPDQDPLRWNWDSALIISPHSHTRLYYAAQRIFRSDDRGDTWKPISGDLTRAIDHTRLEVMGRVQKVDAVARATSTSPYGNIIALTESPLEEGLLYAGTDDGLIQVHEDGNWRKLERFGSVPEMTYVSDLEASRHAVDTVYAVFNNHKNGDFKPYLMKSTDRGGTWTSIVGDLPERGSVHTVVEDHVRPGLLFAGTEFGLFFTLDGGGRWIKLASGLPVIAVRDLEIQRRENDLVVGTFGRGIYILDDYTPLRHVDEAFLERAAALFPIKDALMYIEALPLGLRGKSFQGDAFFTAPNPPFGAVVTYYLKDALTTRKAARKKRDKEAEEAGEPYAFPSWDELRAEDREDDPQIVLTVTDQAGEVVRRLTGPSGAGIHRVAWDLRYPPSEPVTLTEPRVDVFSEPPRGPQVLPGRYTVSLSKQVDGQWIDLGQSQTVQAAPLGVATLEAPDRAALLAFQRRVSRLQRAVLGAGQVAREAQARIDHVKRALLATPAADPGLDAEVRGLETRLKDLQVRLSGDRTLSSRAVPTLPSITARVQRIISAQWTSSSRPTETNREAYRIAGEAFEVVLADLRSLIEQDLAGLEARLEAAGGPWTPGRVPRWTLE